MSSALWLVVYDVVRNEDLRPYYEQLPENCYDQYCYNILNLVGLQTFVSTSYSATIECVHECMYIIHRQKLLVCKIVSIEVCW